MNAMAPTSTGENDPENDSTGTKEDAGSGSLRPDGKASFNAIYDEPTPAAYFSALQPLDYAAPGRAKPIVRRCVEALRRRRGLQTVTVLDLCAGYGVNAALLMHRLNLSDLYQRFATSDARKAGARRIAADAAWFRRQRRSGERVRLIAQDVARQALDYSRAVGLADAVVPANLEERDLTPEQAALLRNVDLIVVTGGMSYIGERTFSRVLEAARRRPWALYLPLRHSDTGAIDRTFEEAGYAIDTSARPVSHRRFQSAKERRAIRAQILERSGPGARPPSTDYLEALVKLARPKVERSSPSFRTIIEPAG